jgi:hypothetical protein
MQGDPTWSQDFIWSLDTAHRGQTVAVRAEPLPSSPRRFIVLERSNNSEIRVCLSIYPQGTETRKQPVENVLCFTIGQKDMRTCSLGFGNPGSKREEDGYRHCVLDEIPTQASFWLLVDATSGWIVLGHGAEPSPDPSSVLLSSKVHGDRAARLQDLKHFAVTNWEEPVNVCVRFDSRPDEVQAKLAGLQLARSTFDAENRAVECVGLTAVAPLPPDQALHAVMGCIRELIAQEPALTDLVALLPPSSFHMTCLEVISQEKLVAAARAHAASTEQQDALPRVVSEQFGALPPAQQQLAASLAVQLQGAGLMQSAQWTTFTMRAVSLDANGRSVELEPWDEQTATQLEVWRNKFAECCHALDLQEVEAKPIVRSVQQWNLMKGEKKRGKYRFHLTIGYVNWPLGRSREVEDAKQRVKAKGTAMLRSLGPVILRAPEFCHFNSMCAFPPIRLQELPPTPRRQRSHRGSRSEGRGAGSKGGGKAIGKRSQGRGR